MQAHRQAVETDRRSATAATLVGVSVYDDVKDSPIGDDRQRAMREHVWLTRDGRVLDDRDRVLEWLVDRGALPEMYRPPVAS